MTINNTELAIDPVGRVASLDHTLFFISSIATPPATLCMLAHDASPKRSDKLHQPITFFHFFDPISSRQTWTKYLEDVLSLCIFAIDASPTLQEGPLFAHCWMDITTGAQGSFAAHKYGDQ